MTFPRCAALEFSPINQSWSPLSMPTSLGVLPVGGFPAALISFYLGSWNIAPNFSSTVILPSFVCLFVLSCNPSVEFLNHVAFSSSCCQDTSEEKIILLSSHLLCLIEEHLPLDTAVSLLDVKSSLPICFGFPSTTASQIRSPRFGCPHPSAL